MFFKQFDITKFLSQAKFLKIKIDFKKWKKSLINILSIIILLSPIVVLGGAYIFIDDLPKIEFILISTVILIQWGFFSEMAFYKIKKLNNLYPKKQTLSTEDKNDLKLIVNSTSFFHFL